MTLWTEDPGSSVHLQFPLSSPICPSQAPLQNEKWLQPRDLPEGDGVGVGTLPLPDQEGPVPGDPHQHVLRFSAAQPVVVPPAAQAGEMARGEAAEMQRKRTWWVPGRPKVRAWSPPRKSHSRPPHLKSLLETATVKTITQTQLR